MNLIILLSTAIEVQASANVVEDSGAGFPENVDMDYCKHKIKHKCDPTITMMTHLQVWSKVGWVTQNFIQLTKIVITGNKNNN